MPAAFHPEAEGGLKIRCTVQCPPKETTSHKLSAASGHPELNIEQERADSCQPQVAWVALAESLHDPFGGEFPLIALPPTNMAPDREPLQEDNDFLVPIGATLVAGRVPKKTTA